MGAFYAAARRHDRRELPVVLGFVVVLGFLSRTSTIFIGAPSCPGRRNDRNLHGWCALANSPRLRVGGCDSGFAPFEHIGCSRLPTFRWNWSDRE